VKLSRISRSSVASSLAARRRRFSGFLPPRSGCWWLAIPASMLVACATTPSQPVVERLDPDTATTVTALRKPVELVAESLHVASGDPFAFLAPFETDRMGKRTQYLWMSAPSVENAKLEPQLLCDGQALTLPPVDGDLSQMGLAHPPYEKPAPWSMQWYFQLPPDTLRCLADAHRVTLQTRADTGQSDQFSAESKDLTTLKAFSNR
jgi:hypothetical protein